MEQHLLLTDVAFEEQFANATLPAAIFTHEAHLRLAWIHILKYGEQAAVNNIRQQLVNYVTKLGAADKYNETLTIAAVKAVHHFIGKKQIDSFADFIATYPRLKYNFKEIIAQHYSIDIFKHQAAKNYFLQPDLLAFT